MEKAKIALRWLLAALNVISPVASAVSAVAALAIVVHTVNEDREDDLEAARNDITAVVFQMGQYDADGGLRNQHEIEALAIEAQQKITAYSQEELHLDARLYRLMAEYVAYSTTDVDLAEQFARAVIDASTADSSEVVFAHRVLGGVAGERGDPALVESEFDQALDINARSLGSTRAGKQIDEFTKAFGLVTAYLGAQNTESSEIHAQFCELATRWGLYLDHIAEHEHNDRLASQLRRLDAKSVTDLAGTC